MSPKTPGRPPTAAQMRLMEGSPAADERQVTLAQWQGPPWNRWAYQHIAQIIPTARVWRGNGGPLPLPREAVKVGHIRFEATDGSRETIASLLRRTYTDGFLVLRKGRIAVEQYFNGMRPHTRHLLQSVSKSITGTVAGALWGRGRLDPTAPLETYLPEVRATSFAGATVRHLLDMTTGTRFSEDYDDPEADIRRYEGAAGWAPVVDDDLHLLSYALKLPNVRAHGAVFEYRSILSDLLGTVLERASGERFADLLSESIWSRMGAEEDAEVTVDRVGNPMTDGGICATLRDLARFGLMVARRGMVNGRRVVPASWISDIRYADAACKEAFQRSDKATRYPQGHYRNQWWVPYDDGRVLLGSGIYGQSLFIDLERDVVIVKLSSLPVAFETEIYGDFLRAWNAVASAITN